MTISTFAELLYCLAIIIIKYIKENFAIGYKKNGLLRLTVQVLFTVDKEVV